LPLPHTCYMPYLSVFVTWSPERYLVPLRPKYPPRHPILENPQPTCLPQCEKPSFTTIQNNWQDYSSVF
jgi:hypothetical protein